MDARKLAVGAPYRSEITLYDSDNRVLWEPSETLIFRCTIKGFPWGNCYEFVCLSIDNDYVRTSKLSPEQVKHLILVE